MWMISMKAVLDIVSQYCPDDDGSCSKAGVDLREMLDEIEGLDETEVVPVQHGRWEYPYPDKDINRCSVCGFHVQDKINNVHEMYLACPRCFARMDGDSND